MNRIIWSVLFAVSATFAGMSAREVMDVQALRHKVPHETTVMKIELIDRRAYQEERILRRLDLDRGNDLMSSLMVFDAPADVRGTALLTRENAGQPNDQWIYFPSRRRLQRIAQARRNGYFMGTDFTYEDMDPESIDDYAYAHVRSENIDSNDYFVIEAVPASEKIQRASGYGKRVLWIRKDILFTIRVEFYDRNGNLMKTQMNSEVENLQGNVWRARRSFMDNINKQHQTIVEVISRDVTTELPETAFTERHILTGRYMQ